VTKSKQSREPIKSSSAFKSISPLYRKPVQATRGGPLFNAFSYPTKISPETIALFIASHTNPGDAVLDCFAGSGTTGLGTMLCAQPTIGMKQKAKSLGLQVKWGPRRAVLFEIGVLGSFIARILSSPPDPVVFQRAAEKLIDEVEKRYIWLYEARSPQGHAGLVRYIIWSNILQCPSCRKPVSLWDACVSRKPANISGEFRCPRCNHRSVLKDVRRMTSNQGDDILGKNRKARLHRPVWVYGSTNGQSWNRPVKKSDLRLLERIESEPITGNFPKVEIPWGDLYRNGYHEGITHLHHFYTRRNLIVFSALWDQVQKQPPELRDALCFWLLSYNASHSTIMTRVVAKKGQEDLVVTSGQPGVLYVSGLPVEKNIFSGLHRKLKTIIQAFEITHSNESSVEVHNKSSLSMDLPDESVDYLFTDPPFGGNIPYAEVNFLNEAWLGRTTNVTDEVIVSPYQGKSVDDYQILMKRALSEANRVLKRNAKATIVFHSSSARVWNSLRAAYEEAGFGIICSSVLDKTQGSFKQVTTRGAVRGDPLILLSKNQKGKESKTASDLWSIVDDLLTQAASANDSIEMTPQRIYSRLVNHYIARRQEVPINAGIFYQQLERRQRES